MGGKHAYCIHIGQRDAVSPTEGRITGWSLGTQLTEKEGQTMKPRQIGVAILCIAVLMVLAGWMPDAAAQAGRGGSRLAPEKAEAARELQAECVAKELGLSKKNTRRLVEAYKAARQTYEKGVRELFEEQGGDRSSRFQAYRELHERERGKLEEALKGILKEKDVAQAMASLGAFNRSWDRYVDTLAGYKLRDKKLFKALALVNQYVVDTDKAMGLPQNNIYFFRFPIDCFRGLIV